MKKTTKTAMQRAWITVVAAGLTLMAGAVGAGAQVALLSPAPATVAAGGGVMLRGTGFPAGPIQPAAVVLTLTPASGSPVTAPATELLPAPGGYMIAFNVPASLASQVTTPEVFTLTAAGQTTAGTAFTTAQATTLTVLPPGSISGLSPAQLLAGTSAEITVSGAFTHFATTSALVFSPSAGISVSNVQVSSTLALTAQVTIDPGAAAGPRTVSVVTGSEQAVYAPGFVVTQPASLAGVSPSSAQQGAATLTVNLVGANTHWDASTTAQFGADGKVTVDSLVVADATHATATISVAPTAPVGTRTVTVTTGAEVVSSAAGFSVTPGTPVLLGSTPASGAQAATLTLTLAGQYTHWQQGVTQVSLGSGATVNSVTINGASDAQVSVTVNPLAVVGSCYAVAATTNAEQVSLPSAFCVTAGPAALASLAPTSGYQGQTLNVAITGANTHFQASAPATVASFGAGITVNSLSVSGPTTATANISIAADADMAQLRTVTLTTAGETATLASAFAVTPAPMLASVSPASAQQGAANQTINLVGANTHWGADTTVQFGADSKVTVGSLAVADATHATAIISVDPTAPVGARPVTVTTGTEVVSSAAGFSVTPGTPVLLSNTPVNGAQGATLTLTLGAQYTHWQQGITQMSLGDGATVNSVTVSDATDAQVSVTVNPLAAVGSCYDVTATTNAEQVSLPGAFCVTVGSAALAALSPNSGNQDATLDVIITGANTHFRASAPATTASFGAGVTVNSLSVASATLATANISIAADADTTTARTVTLATRGETASLAGAFAVTTPAPTLVSLTPSSAQQGADVVVTVTGANTHWGAGTTVQFGSDSKVLVDNLSVVDATHLTATLTVLSTAPVGARAVTITTGSEVVTADNGFTITPGTPVLLSSAPASGAQGATVTLTLAGQYTHWLQGTTQVSLGDGAAVNSVTVSDATDAQVSVTVDPLATVGSCDAVTVTTGAEQVSLPTVFCVTSGPAALTSVSPVSGPAGYTTTVTITGQATHFAGGLTTVSFGSNINVSNVQVTSPTTATADLAVLNTAPLGPVDATVSTKGEVARLASAFTVLKATPVLNAITPATVQQGQSGVTVQLTGQYTHWDSTTTATFGQGITLDSLSVADATHATAVVDVDPVAFAGSRTVTLVTGGEIVASSALQVTASAAAITQVTPGSANQGQEVLLSITGNGTHWSQGLTQFGISGSGSDVHVNAVVINSATSASADLTLSPTAALGARSVTMVTGGEDLADNSALVVTGGIPAITFLSPGSGHPGDASLSVVIHGSLTTWTQGTPTADFGANSGITLQSLIVNDDTTLTAVVNIAADAALGYDSVTVRDGSQTLTGVFQVVSLTPPTPAITYLSPSVGLPGQTFTVQISGQNTNWDATTQASFDSSITVNSFQVVNSTSATANITIAADAAAGQRSLTLVTSSDSEQESAAFEVVTNQPAIALVDPPTGMQGVAATVNVIGAYTTFDNTTSFDFGTGITVTGVTILGPTAAAVSLQIDQLAPAGTHSVSATTGAQIASGGNFTVTPSTAAILSLTPNTAHQGDTLTATVVGQNTHWDGSTVFTLGGITVTAATVNASAQTAALNLEVPALAATGPYSLIATTGGEVATLTDGFIVQAGTPVILSSAPNTGVQQQELSLTVLGQLTNWSQGSTTASLGDGVTVISTTVTSPTALTADVLVQPTAAIGWRTLAVSTGGQTLTLGGAFYVAAGPAAITALTPNSGKQGQTLDVGITGTNTNFDSTPGVTTATFGSGITVNTLTVTGLTTATANITIAANANTTSLRTVTVTTAGETAIGASIFTVNAATPVLSFINPASLAQGATATVAVSGLFTHFTAATVFNFGPGITVNSISGVTDTTASVNLTVAPTATVGPVSVTATTGTEVAEGTGLFAIATGPAAIASVAPNSGQQNQSGEQVVITGAATHFTAATPSVSFGTGITVTQVQVSDDLHLTATLNLAANASVGPRTPTVTTGGEAVSLPAGFSVTAGQPVLASANPAIVHQNDTLDIAVVGQYTHFVQGSTTASFSPADIDAIAATVTVTDATDAIIHAVVSPTAALSSHTITLTTGGETATGVGLLTVAAGQPQLVSVSPSTGAQGSTQTLTITGLYTSFQPGVSTVSVGGGGITAGAVTVTGPTQLQVPVTVTPGAAAGARSVTVTTGSETASLAGAFTVEPGLPAITVIDPNEGVANSTVTVTITGQFTHFVNGTTQASFGSGIAVNGAAEGGFGTIVVNSATSATATLALDAAAITGARDVTVQTGAEMLTVNAGFTVQTASPTAPSVAYISPASNATGVPTNTSVTLGFTAPLDRTTVGTQNVLLEDGTLGYGCSQPGNATPSTVSVDASGRVVTLTPSAVLAVGHQYYLCLNYPNNPGGFVMDPSGNKVAWNDWVFTTGFTPDTSGPALTYANIADGATNVGTNVSVILGFTQPINPTTTAAGFTVSSNGVPLTGTFGYNQTYTQITFTPSAALTPSTAYTVTYTSALADSTGTALANPGSFSFTTGSGSDTTAPHFLTWTPRASETTGTNPVIEGILSAPVNPLSVTASTFYVRNQITGAVIPGSTVSFSPDRTILYLTLAGPLDPGTEFYWQVTGTDPAGNYFSGSDYFYTATGPITTPPTVVAVSPIQNASGVSVNPQISIQYSGNLDWNSVTNAITLSPAVAGSVALGSDNRTLTFTPSANLATGTLYTITVAGLRDTQGNNIPSFQWGMTTGAVSTPDTSHGTITMTPASNATNVPTNAQVVLTLSKPVNPASISLGSARLYDNSVSGNPTLPGGFVASADGLTMTYTPPAGGFAPSHRICSYIGESSYLYDWSGNYFGGINQCFTTAATADTTAPTVLAVMPTNGSTGIGPNNPVTVTFSKPMNPSTLTNGQNVAIYQGSTLYTTGISIPSDASSLTFNSGALPYNTTFTVVINPGVTDLAGNALAAEFSSTFTTMARPDTVQPAVTAFRPGAGASGVAASTPLTFFLSQPIDPSTVVGALTVAQNGALVTGAVDVSADDQVVTFTPSAPLTAGALVQLWFSSAATDPSGNALQPYSTSFTVAPNVSGQVPVLTSVSLGGSNHLTNMVIDAAFNQPMDPATVSSATFFVQAGGSGSGIAGTVTLLNHNTVLRFTPDAPLTASGYYVFNLTSGLKSAAEVAYGGTRQGITVGTTSDTTPLTVTAIAPTDGSSGIGVNALIRVTFSKPLETATVDATTLTLSSNSTPIPYTFSVDSAGSTLTLTPQAPLPASAPVTVTATGDVSDVTGQASAPFAATFQTGSAPIYTDPVVVASNVVDGASNVPVTSVFTVTFDRAMDTRSYTSGNFYLRDQFTGVHVAAAISYNADGSQLTLAPAAPLALDRNYDLIGCSLTDLNGNSTCNTFSYSFTTALTAPAGGPQVLLTTPQNHAANVPVNLLPEIEFDRPVARPTLANVQLLQGGSTPVPFTASFSSGDTIVTLTPQAILQPDTAYLLNIAGVTDVAGGPMAAPVEVPFTTGSGLDLVAPQVVSVTPASGQTTGTNPVLRVVFNEPLDPIRSYGWYLHNQSDGGASAPGVAVSYSADRQVMTITYLSLQPNSNYNWSTGYVYDAAGNYSNTAYSFTTGAGADTTAPTVTAATPPNGASQVPLNALIELQLSEPLDATTINANSLTLSSSSGAVAGTVALSSGGTVLGFVPSAGLAAGATYTITASGFADLDGNAAAPYQSTFTTASANLSGNGTISLTSPAPNATGVDVNTAITLAFNRPVDPMSINTSSIQVQAQVGTSYDVVAGTAVLSPDGQALTFTPLAPLPASTAIRVYASYYANVEDLTGDNFSYNYFTFTTGAAAAAAPTVLAVTPADGATGAGPSAVVTLQFSESLNPSTINSYNFALYNGYTNLSASVSRSADNRTVTLSTTLPYSATITVSVGTGVSDLAGNALAAPFRSTFTTIANPPSARPSITQMRPANGSTGVPLNSLLTFYASAPIDASTLAGNVVVTQNGVQFPGTVALAANQQAIVFTPTANFAANALIQVFITSSVTDTSANPLNAYAASFTTATDLTGVAPTLVGNPQNSSNNPTNTAIVLMFNKPIDGSTVNTSDFYVTYSGTPLAATITQPEPNVLRLQPTAPLPANAYTPFYVTAGAIKDTEGLAYGGGGWGMYTIAGPDNSLPAVASVSPANGAGGVGDNTAILVTFNKLMDTTSINAATVTLTSAAQPLPFNLSFGSVNGSGSATTMTLTPQAPLPDNAQITLALGGGVMDFEGNAITPQTVQFGTGNGPDFIAPGIVTASPVYNATNVPVTANFVWVLNEPIDPARVSYSLRDNGNSTYIPANVQVSPDGRTLTLTPTTALTYSTNYSACSTVYDLSGNTSNLACISIITASATSAATPQVVLTTPVPNQVNVPTNTGLYVLFNEPVSGASLGQVTLTANGVPVAVQASLSTGSTILELTPAALLTANTPYTLTVAGVQDLGGNAMAAPYIVSFTTGSSPDLATTNFLSASVTVGGVLTQLNSSTLAGVDDNPSFTIQFSDGVLGPYLLYNSGLTLRTTNGGVTVPVAVTLSADGTTVTLTPLSPLAPATGYALSINYYGAVYNQAGYTVSASGLFHFTTQ